MAREGGRTGISLNELLDAFGVRRFTDASRDRLSEALEEAELSADPSLYDVERGDHLTLTLVGQRGARMPVEPERPSGMQWAASGAASSATGGGLGARRVGTRSASDHAGALGAVAASTAAPDEHASRRWYQRPRRLVALAAVLLLALVWLGDDEAPPSSDPSSSQGVVVSGQEDTEGDSTRDEAQAQARRRREEAREARERR